MLRDLAKHPKFQAKIWEELAVVEKSSNGTDEIITLLQTKQLNWTQAACYETIRMTCSPIVPHRATVDTTLGGENRSSGCY